MDLRDLKKEFNTQRLHIWSGSFMTIIGLLILIDFLGEINGARIGLLLLGLILFWMGTRSVDRARKGSLSNYSNDHAFFIKQFDAYTKASLIWLLILSLAVCNLFYYLVSLSFNLKPSELFAVLIDTTIPLGIVGFFFLKNTLMEGWLCKNYHFEHQHLFEGVMKKIAIISGAYFALSLMLYYAFEKFFVYKPLLFLNIVYICFGLYCFFYLSKKFTYSKKTISKIVLIPMLILLIVSASYLYLSRNIWLTQPFINQVPYLCQNNHEIEYDDTSGVYTITSTEENFKILQLTDIHLGGGVISYEKDLQALEAVYRLLVHTRPDLVIVTGDLTYPVGVSSFSFNNSAPVSQFAAFMRNTGIPWAFTYGNHDTENVAFMEEETIGKLYESLSFKMSRTLLYPYVQPKVNGKTIYGRNNQLIEIRNGDGTLNQALFLLDTNEYTRSGFSTYDTIHDDQVKWYEKQITRLQKEEKGQVSSLEFFHIPLKEYATAYNRYAQGDKEVKYYFGNNGEKICASEKESKLFSTAKELKTSKGFFCGHDHYNNISLEYEGIRLTYGMSIDYLATPGIARDTKQRGATLITAHSDSTVDIKQIPLDNIKIH